MEKTYDQFMAEAKKPKSAPVGGLEYEAKVRKAIKKVEKNLQIEMMPDLAGGFAANVVDLYLKIGGKKYGFEIKQNAAAQMGGTSVMYDKVKKEFAFSNTKGAAAVDEDTKQMILEALEPMMPKFNKFINYIRREEPTQFHKAVKGFPMTCAKTAWENATSDGLLQPLNTKIKMNEQFISDHYAHKGCYYIQIGGAGLFYMKRNPLKLPVPKLKGDINIEIRPGRSGSKENKTIGIKVVGGGIRVQGRLQFNGKSPYTLDNPKHVVELFGNM